MREHFFIKTILNKFLSSISSAIFDISLNVLDGAERLIAFDMGNIDNFLFIVSLTVCMALITMKYIKLKSSTENDLVSIQIIRDNIRFIIPGIIIFLLLNQYKDVIVRFTFEFWSDMFNEQKIIEFFKSTELANGEQGLIVCGIIGVIASVTSLVIAFGQIIEIISLKIVLMLSPFFLLFTSNKQGNIRKIYIIGVAKMCLEPILQTIIMFIFLRILKTLEMSLIFKLMLLPLSIILPKGISNLLYPEQKIMIDINIPTRKRSN